MGSCIVCTRPGLSCKLEPSPGTTACSACHDPAQEDTQRYQIFVETVRRVVDNNNDDTTTFWSGLNQFSAMTLDELRATLLRPGTAPPITIGDNNKRARAGQPSARAAYPATKDWAGEGFVTPVKDQGNVSFPPACILAAIAVVACWAPAGPLQDEDLLGC